MAVDGEDNILVVDAGICRLFKFSRGGDPIAAVGSHGDGLGQFKSPCGVSVNENVYVVDNMAHCVHIFNSDLTFFSKFGSGDGQFDSTLRPIVVVVCMWLIILMLECKSSHPMVAT